MIPVEPEFWENWNRYVSQVNQKRLDSRQCRISDELPAWFRGYVNTCLAELGWRDRAVMRLRFGLEDGEFWTYWQIAEQFEISTDCVRQIVLRLIRRFSWSPVRREKIDRIRNTYLETKEECDGQL